MSAKVSMQVIEGNQGKNVRSGRKFLTACVALSITLLPLIQSTGAEAKPGGARSTSGRNVQIAALPFFKKTDAKDAVVAKGADTKTVTTETKKVEVKNDKVQAAATAKADKKKAKEVVVKDADKTKTEKTAVEKTEVNKETKAATTEIVEEKVASENATDDKAPVYSPDASLISVLKDLSKSLKDAEQLQKLSEDANQQAVLGLAQAIIARSLENADLSFNRIISVDEERAVNRALTPESWASEVISKDGVTGSLTAVWAKRVNGLLSVTVAGKAPDKTAPNGKKIGNFVVVLTGRSPIEAGFDIQTQSNVNFWLGQLAAATVDSDCLTDTQSAQAPTGGEGDVKKKSLMALPILVTDRVSAYKKDVVAYEIRKKNLALKAEEESKAKEDRNQVTAKAIAEATAKVLAEATNRALTKADEPLKDDGKGDNDTVAQKNVDDNDLQDVKDQKDQKDSKVETSKTGEKKDTFIASKLESRTETKKETKSTRNPNIDINTKDDVEKGAIKPVSAVKVKTEEPLGSQWSSPENSSSSVPDKVAIAVPNTRETYKPSPSNNQSGWESPANANSNLARVASQHATIIAPERAVAGQFLTTSVLDKNRSGEPSVELSFNGASLATDARGQALYMVPEDATPGHSLNVSITSRPELSSGTVEVLQPLMTAYEPQVPKIDRISTMVSSNTMITIDGHNFDGNAEHNRLLIDGFHEAKVIAASPVQIKALLPAAVKPGSHSICVGNAGMRSNSATVDVIATEVQQDPREIGRENLSKLVVKVLGTNSKVNIKLTNNTPDVLRISKGNDFVVTTPGGANNFVTFGVQRLKKGAYNVEAAVEQ